MKIAVWLAKRLRAYRASFVAVFLILIAETTVYSALIVVQQTVLDAIIGSMYASFWLYVGLYVCGFITVSALQAAGGYLTNRKQLELQNDLCVRLHGKLSRYSIRDFQQQRIARYVSFFTDDVERTAQFVFRHLPSGIQQIAYCSLLMIIAAYVHLGMLAGIVAISAAYIAAARYFQPKLWQAHQRSMEGKTDFLVHVEEGISSTREVIAFNRTHWENNRIGAAFARYYKLVLDEVKLGNRHLLYSEPIKWSVNLFVLGFGGYLVFVGKMSIGTYAILFHVSNQLMYTLHAVYQFVTGMPGELVHAERLRAAMDATVQGYGELREFGPVTELRLEHVSFSYGSKEVLDKVSLELPSGKKIAIVGFSGAAKSTLAGLIAGLHDPDNGHIIVNGKPLGEIRRDDWSKLMAIVFQEPYLFPDTIRTNLLLGEAVEEDVFRRICTLTLMDEWVNRLDDGYDTVIGERGLTLSGGQRQRIAIARALLRDPDVLMLDEATSALDVESERKLQRNMDALRRGKTTIIIAHRLSTVANADLIVVLNEGKVAEQGTHKELQGQGRLYGQLLAAQQQQTKEIAQQ